MPGLLKGGQTWVADLFFGLLVFIAVLIIFFKSEVNYSEADEQAFDDIVFESKLVTDSLLSAGYPSSWTPATVEEIGITDDYRVNESKLEYLGSMNYSQTKSRLRTKYDYYFFFEGVDGIIDINSTHEGLGKPGINSTDYGSPHNLVRVNRFVVFRSEPAKMVVYLWN
jgi:hypothetical protein